MEQAAHRSLAGQTEVLNTALEWIAFGTEALAMTILVVGLLRFVGALAATGMGWRDPGDRGHGLTRGRLVLGHHILAALEVLIVADLIRTTLDMTPNNLILLGGLVAIRSLISFFLDRELDHLARDGDR